jgi:hypothetical protein
VGLKKPNALIGQGRIPATRARFLALTPAGSGVIGDPCQVRTLLEPLSSRPETVPTVHLLTASPPSSKKMVFSSMEPQSSYPNPESRLTRAELANRGLLPGCMRRSDSVAQRLRYDCAQQSVGCNVSRRDIRQWPQPTSRSQRQSRTPCQ